MTDVDDPVVLVDRPVVLDAAEPAPPVVDARFRVRRTEVRRRMRRRRRRIALSVVAVIVAALVSGGVLVSPLADVDDVHVVGAQHLTSEEVVAASGIRTGSALFAVDPSAVRKRLLRMPWVERARVAVRWPSGVDVKVVERPVLAVVTQGDSAFLVGRGGMVVARAGAPDEQEAASQGVWRPSVQLPADVAPRVGRVLPRGVARAVEMVAAIPSSIRPWVSGATIDEQGEVSFTVGLGSNVRLGTPEDVDAKFVAAETMLGGSVELRCLADLDLRVPADPRITRGNRC